MGKRSSIECIPRYRLDTQWWDSHVEASENGSIYGLSAVLDITAEKRWMVLWDPENECGHAIAYRGWHRFPVKIGQPLFCRYGGIFYTRKPSENVLQNFLKAIPESVLGTTVLFSWPHIPPNHCNSIIFQSLKFPEEFQPDAHHRRHIRKAEQKGLILSNAEEKNLVEAFFSGRGSQYTHLNRAARQRMLHLLEYLSIEGLGHCYQICDEIGEVHAYGYFGKWRGRITYLHGALCDPGRASSASYFLMVHAMKELGDDAYMLDFGGSNDEGTARFYRGFGGRDQEYFRYSTKGLF
jgi:hypothetical protein